MIMATIERAIEIAVGAHAGQREKAGASYITHPLRVMAAVTDGEAQIVAVLHDVVEASGWTIDELRAEGFSETVLVAVDALTRRDGEAYVDFVDRAKSNALARIVKRADLLDNIERTRLARSGASDDERSARYVEALARLEETDVLGG
jgi:(p)ppGpp synthase/HD superfamily hydrolase